MITALPPVVDLRPGMPPVCYDQGVTNSCVGHAIAAPIQYNIRRQGLDDWMPSPLFIYSNARRLEDGLADDSGCEIRDGIKGVVQWGVCYNDDWPLILDNISVMPALRCYADAKTHLISRYSRVTQSLNALKTCLAGGWPFPFGFNVYREFESDEVAETGKLPMPAKGSSAIGGHAVVAVGYRDDYQAFLVRNSYGDGWGINGHFWHPYEYVTNPGLASDFWVTQSMTI
jgi:C1A family cysteine protease